MKPLHSFLIKQHVRKQDIRNSFSKKEILNMLDNPLEVKNGSTTVYITCKNSVLVNDSHFDNAIGRYNGIWNMQLLINFICKFIDNIYDINHTIGFDNLTWNPNNTFIVKLKDKQIGEIRFVEDSESDFISFKINNMTKYLRLDQDYKEKFKLKYDIPENILEMFK